MIVYKIKRILCKYIYIFNMLNENKRYVKKRVKTFSCSPDETQKGLNFLVGSVHKVSLYYNTEKHTAAMLLNKPDQLSNSAHIS